MLKVLDLFSGIGGFSLGLERTGGFETVAFCENEKSGYPQKVLAKHWPGVPIYEDVKELTAERLIRDGIRPTVITGGFPCQDISVAGNQKGIGEGTRSGLWSECARLLGEIRPQWAIFENVTALLSGGGEGGEWFQQVLWDISEVGYDAEWHCIPASELGANHHRDRVWIIAYPNGADSGNEREEMVQKYELMDKRETLSNNNGKPEYVAHTMRQGLERHGEFRGDEKAIQEKAKPILSTYRKGSIKSECWSVEPELGRVADGIRDRSHRLKGLGNAICPPISELIGRAILEAENEAM
jgi:DNA (cytosine-5)-methyltransferase 1